MGDWFDIGGSAIGAIGSMGGGILGAGESSDGYSQKGAGQQLMGEFFGAPVRGKALLRFAKAAGLHPLAVIGSGATAQPVIAGQSGDNSSIGYGVSEALKGIGQDISSARMRQQNEDMRDLELIGKATEIDNDTKYGELLSEQIRQIRNPPAPIPNSTNSDVDTNPYGEGVITKKAEVISNKEGATRGSNASESYFTRQDPKTGRVVHFRSKAQGFAESTEEAFMANLAQNVHEGIVVLTGTFIPPYNPPTDVPLKPGYVWKWSNKWPYQGWYQGISMETHWKNQRKKGLEYYKGGGKYIPTPKHYKWKEVR